MTGSLILVALLSLVVGVLGGVLDGAPGPAAMWVARVPATSHSSPVARIPSAEHCLSLISNLVVLNSASPNFDAAKQPFNLRISTSPSLIVFP